MLKVDVNNLVKILLLILITLGFIFLFQFISSFVYGLIAITIPFIIAFAVSFIVNPWVKYLEKKNISHKISVVIVIVFLLSLLIIFSIFLAPLLNKELTYFIENLPIFIEKINNLFNNIPVIKKLGIDLKTIIGYFFKNNTDFFENIMKFFVAIFSSFIPVITTPILIIYFIIYYEKIEEWIKNKTINNSWLFNILKEIKESMQLYFKSYLLITLVLSFFSSIAFALLKIEYFLIWGIIIGITNIIPYIGPYIGGGIVGLYVLTSTPDLLLYVIIIIVCLQVIESNFLTPKIQGDTLKINPILVVFSITFFGKILGIIGMIIAVPVVQIIQIVVNGKKLLKKR